jgi:nicotinamidase-related amidase
MNMSSSPLAEETATAGVALLVIDMISDWRKPEMADLMKAARHIAPCIARMKERCRQAGVPVIYANDNLGRWRSDFKALIDAALSEGGAAAEIAQALAPDKDDYFVLKPKHSAFFVTPLDLLLQHLRVSRLILAGVAADQCVLATAGDALMRDYEVNVLKDGVAAQTPERTARALRHFEEVMDIPTAGGADIVLPPASSPH